MKTAEPECRILKRMESNSVGRTWRGILEAIDLAKEAEIIDFIDSKEKQASPQEHILTIRIHIGQVGLDAT